MQERHDMEPEQACVILPSATMLHLVITTAALLTGARRRWCDVRVHRRGIGVATHPASVGGRCAAYVHVGARLAHFAILTHSFTLNSGRDGHGPGAGEEGTRSALVAADAAARSGVVLGGTDDGHGSCEV